MAGFLLDRQGHGLLLWVLMASVCLLMVPLLKTVRPRYTPGLSAIPLEKPNDVSSPRTASLR